MYVRAHSDALEQLVHLLVAELLAQAGKHVAQLAHANVARALLVKDLEAAHELFCDCQPQRRA